MTDTRRVDRLSVPPNMADAMSTAVFNGRHGDACGILRDLWAFFGFEGAPRLIVVLAKHRSDANHWVVPRFVDVLLLLCKVIESLALGSHSLMVHSPHTTHILSRLFPMDG